MQRALQFLGLACAGSAGAAYYAHWQQRSEKHRMHQGVVRDMAREEAERRAAAGGTQLDTLAAAACEGDVCALATRRIREVN